MTKAFSELADRARAAWSDDTQSVYETVTNEFTAEVDGRAALGSALATARKAQGLTQSALSELAGIQQAEISRIERGAGNPTAVTLLRLTDVLGQKLVLVPVEK